MALFQISPSHLHTLSSSLYKSHSQTQNHYSLSHNHFSTMASNSHAILPTTLSLFFFFFLSLLTPSYSALTCASQKLPPHRTYDNCTDLPVLGATLHFTFNAANHSLAVAFSAEPPKSDGWVAWGINPSGGGMIGTQALIAFKSNSNVGVHLYNLTAYKGIDQVKSLSFDTWDVAAEEANGVITIFATVKVPEKADNLSQVWQVGPVTGGKPSIHELKPENIGAKAALSAVPMVKSGGGNNSAGGNVSGSGGNSNSSMSGEKSGGALVKGERFGMGFYLGLVLVLMSLVAM
ncbi:hypothetical protein RJT34_21969 [Clitoria ternatea]|uniref:DOMON domain-containing protein n=1 Tax=Clitoria ternatea TaxID=43366 RepID=A0AAN9IWA6_CLITE